MEKRVLVNLNEPGTEPYWTYVPVHLNLRQPTGPQEVYPFNPAPKRKPTQKAFANPFGKGYGDSEAPWPFDHNRAYHDKRYRTGIRNATKANWAAEHWKYYAKRQLDRIVFDIFHDQNFGLVRVYKNESNYSEMQINFTSVFLYCDSSNLGIFGSFLLSQVVRVRSANGYHREIGQIKRGKVGSEIGSVSSKTFTVLFIAPQSLRVILLVLDIVFHDLLVHFVFILNLLFMVTQVI